MPFHLSVADTELREAGIERELSFLFLQAGMELNQMRMRKLTELTSVKKVSWLLERIFSQNDVVMKDSSAVVLFSESLRICEFLPEDSRQMRVLSSVIEELRNQLNSVDYTMSGDFLRRLIALMAVLSMKATVMERR